MQTMDRRLDRHGKQIRSNRQPDQSKITVEQEESQSKACVVDKAYYNPLLYYHR